MKIIALPNDYDHYLRFAMAGAKFYHLPEVLYSVRYHGNDRKTGQHRKEQYENLIEESRRCARRARGLTQISNTDYRDSTDYVDYG